eukprot:2669991-Pleurochrysis_carterae.AAC.1
MRVHGELDLGGTPPLSWNAMWTLLDSRAPAPDAEELAAPASAPAAAASSQSLAPPLTLHLRGNALREALSRSVRASDVNIVLHPGYTEVDARRAALEEECATYLNANFE